MQRIIERHGAEEAVRCIGHVAGSRMRETMAGYGAMALPSCPESFGLVYLEAIAAGIPVLSSRGYALDGLLQRRISRRDSRSEIRDSHRRGHPRTGRGAPKFAAAFANIGPEWQRFTRSHIQAAYLDVLQVARDAR